MDSYELPPLPQEFVPMEYYPYAITPFESLSAFPSSDFIPSGDYTFSDNDQDLFRYGADSSLSLLTRHHMEKLFNDDVSPQFLHLPDLKSFEQTTTVENTKPSFLSLSPPPPIEKRRRLTCLVKNTFTISPSPQSSFSKSLAPSFPQSSYGGESRQRKISDKIRSLEKLMPWEKKMSLATILEEAHKYITFLQSQIALLRWMPLESVYTTTTGEDGKTDLLKSLTRQQILQVIANSPGARTVLYTRGVCVFSYEQLLSFKMISQNSRNF